MRDCLRTLCCARTVSRLACWRSPLAGVRAAHAAELRARRSRASPTDNFNETDAGIAEVAASGDPRRRHDHRGAAGRPPAVQRRAEEGLLQGQAPASCSTPRPAQPVAAPSRPTSSPVRVNNRLRRAHRCGARRPDAAGGRSRQAASRRRRRCSSRATPARCRRSMPRSPRKPTPRIKQALTEARAAVMLVIPTTPSEADKLDRRRRHRATAAIRTRCSLLAGLPADAPADVQRAARDAVTAIENQPRRLEHGAERSGTASRSARCCCSPPSALPSPSA